MLLKKANTITTPTAYSNGFLHSVKPEVVLGEELVVNGSFDTDSNWTKGTGWTISGGKANCDGTQTGNSSLTQQGGILGATLNLVVGVTYEINLDVIVSQGAITSIEVGGDYNLNDISTSGNYTLRFTPTSTNNRFTIAANSDFIGSVDNASIKQDISADFTFQRNSSATRVNELGYIEDVQIIGGELVSNGNFEQIGSELITNGSFSDGGTNWTYSGLVTFADGSASFVDNGTNTNTYIEQNIFTANKFYKVSIDVTRYNAGRIQILYGASTYDLNISGGIGTYVVYLKPSSNLFRIKRNGGYPNYDFDIDNVSVKEVGQDWTFGNGWSMGDGKAVFSDTANGDIRTQFIFTAGNKYRINLSVSDLTSGTAFFALGDGASNNLVTYDNYANGDYTFDVTAVNGAELRIYATTTSSSSFSIDNISVKEVTDDTNLPRINYEGFTYENGLPVPYSGKGHLLLEGQRTNVAYKVGGLAIVGASETSNFGISPSGDNDSTKLESTVSGVSYVRTSNLNTVGTLACSVFFKKGVGDYIQLLHAGNGNHYANYDLVNKVVTSSGSATTASIESYGDWLRLIAVFDSVSVSADFRCYLSDNPTAGYGGASSAVGNYIEYWGFQAEEGDYATSYIANTKPSTTVTRLGETCNNATQSFPSEGVLYAEIAALSDDGGFRQISINDATSNNIVQIDYTSTSNQIRGVVISGGSLSALISFVSSDVTLFSKVALRYKENDFSLWVDGVEVGTDISGTVSSGLTKLSFDNGSGNNDFYGKTKMVATFSYLSNDEMECLTGEGYGTFEALAAAYSYTIK